MHSKVVPNPFKKTRLFGLSYCRIPLSRVALGRVNKKLDRIFCEELADSTKTEISHFAERGKKCFENYPNHLRVKK